MNNPDIYRYERELGKAVQGFRRRKKVLTAFRSSLPRLLEELDNPVYEDLEEAFGPPNQMAQDLIEALPDLPKPLRSGQKIGIVVLVCLIVGIACLGSFYMKNLPESIVKVSDKEGYTEEALQSNYGARIDGIFNHHDFVWKQGKEYKGYLLLFENTNQVDTNVTVKYSDYQQPHHLVVPAGEQRVLQVDDARPTEHTISFSTSDGSMSGTVQVFLRLPS